MSQLFPPCSLEKGKIINFYEACVNEILEDVNSFNEVWLKYCESLVDITGLKIMIQLNAGDKH